MLADPGQLSDPDLQWRLRPLLRQEVPLACALVLAVEGPGYDLTRWRGTARRWLAPRSAAAGRRIMTVRNRGGLIFALCFCANERLDGLPLLAVSELRVAEPLGGRQALAAALEGIDRLLAEAGCAAALIRADTASRCWGELAAGLATVGRCRGWHRHGPDWLRPGPGGLAVLPRRGT